MMEILINHPSSDNAMHTSRDPVLEKWMRHSARPGDAGRLGNLPAPSVTAVVATVEPC
jgi:hypothetical protein